MFNFLLWLFLGLTAAHAQNTTCATRPPGDSSNACASTAFVHGGFLPATGWTANNPLIGSGTGGVTQGVRSGNTTAYVTADTTPVNGNCATWDAAGGLSSTPCSPSGSGTVGSGLQGQIAGYTANGTSVVGIPVCTPFETFGGSTGNTGAANDTALNALLTSFGGNRGCVSFGAGTYTFAASHSYTFNAGLKSLTMRGAGRDVTILAWPSTDGLIINYPDCQGNSFNLYDMTLDTGGTATNTGLHLICTTGTANTVLSAMNTIRDAAFIGASAYSAQAGWANGIKIEGVNNINFIDDNFIGYTPSLVLANGQGTGVNLGPAQGTSCSGNPCAGTVYNFVGCNFSYGQTGIQYGSYVQGVSVVASNFVAPLFGILVPGGTLGTLDQLSVTGSQFNTVNISILLGALVTDINITGNLFINALSTSASGFSGIVSYGTITGNNFWAGSAASHVGVLLSTNSNGVVITGNTFENLNIGWEVQTPAGSKVNVQSNMYVGNTTNSSPASSSGQVTVGGGSP